MNSNDPPGVDPDKVPEVFCAGQFNVSFATSGFCTMTFTHLRAKAGSLLDAGQIDMESVVRARIVMPMDSMIALRNLLNAVIQDQPTVSASVTRDSSKLN